ncbi:MAG: GAF domain-containing protein [Gemmatimonadales bacterium]
MSETSDLSSAEDPLASSASEPLVPILRVDAEQLDQIALATWHEALSDTLAVEVPHDLMGLWLYPSQGGAVLIGPAELAEDDLAIPLPSPHLKPEELSRLEQTVSQAGYGSVACLPVKFGKRDVALLLMADLRGGLYGAVERVVLQCVTQRIAPMLGRVARQWKASEGSASRQQERIAGLLEAIAEANRATATPQRFLAAISRGLAPLLPHEHVELLASDSLGKRYFRLGEHPGGPLWQDPSLIISRDHLDVGGIFGLAGSLLVGDTYGDSRWPRGFLTASEPAGADIRGLVGARLNLRGNVPAYLLLGSVGPEFYAEEDAELLVLLAGLIAPQISGFLTTEEAPALAPVLKPVENHPHAELIFRVAGLLATTSDPAVATELIASEARSALPYDRLTFALRMTQTDRVIMLEPGEKRPLSHLPLVSVADTPLARILKGDLPCGFVQNGNETRMIVPLRVAGRVHGALVLSSETPGTLTEHHVLIAQHLADIIAAHFELLRRGAMLPHPTASRWRSDRKADTSSRA